MSALDSVLRECQRTKSLGLYVSAQDREEISCSNSQMRPCQRNPEYLCFP